MWLSKLLAGVAVTAGVLLTGAVAEAQKRPHGWGQGSKPWGGGSAGTFGATWGGGTPPGFGQG
jgi:hypothetical protein